MASDASERGGGFVMARRLTERGIKALKKAESGEDQARSGILVINMLLVVCSGPWKGKG